LSSEEVAIAQRLSVRLGAGELSCLAVAIARSHTLASDDFRARRLARERGVAVTGTVGILAACVRLGYLAHDRANALLAAMIAAGYRSPVENMDALLEADR